MHAGPDPGPRDRLPPVQRASMPAVTHVGRHGAGRLFSLTFPGPPWRSAPKWAPGPRRSRVAVTVTDGRGGGRANSADQVRPSPTQLRNRIRKQGRLSLFRSPSARIEHSWSADCKCRDQIPCPKPADRWSLEIAGTQCPGHRDVTGEQTRRRHHHTGVTHVHILSLSGH